MGIQCAFFHSTVDDSFAPGIGKRLDGWANRDLNVGAISRLLRTSSREPAHLDRLRIGHLLDTPGVRKVTAQFGGS